LKIGAEPRVNGIRILPFDLETRMGPTEICAPLVSILHKLLIAVFITAAYENVIVQIFFIIVVNLLYAIYLLLKKPYIRVGWKKFTSEMIVHNMAVITLTLMLILIFKVQMSSMTPEGRNSFGLGICLSIVYGLTSNLVYFAYRTYNFYFDNIWRKFV
jgi:drug/metabolite transporter (DMT)-like permease